MKHILFSILAFLIHHQKSHESIEKYGREQLLKLKKLGLGIPVFA